MTEPTTEAGRGSGTTTECPLVGVHEHPFRGPHTFTEWYEAEALQWDRLWRAFSLVFSFVPDAEEQRLVREHYEADR